MARGKGKRGLECLRHPRGRRPALHACEAPFIQGSPPTGDGSWLGGYQYHPALSPLCRPYAPPASHAAIFRATLDSPFVVLKDKSQVAKVGDYLAERLATIATLVDKSRPAVAVLFDAIP